MSQRKKCSSKVPADLREKPEKCLSKGVSIGMNLPVSVSMDMSKDMIRAIAAKHKVPRYSTLTKQQLYDAILAKGVKKINLRELL